MNNNTLKNQFQSLSSLSLSQNLKDINNSSIAGARKSSFDLVNLLGDSSAAYFNRSKLQKSLDMLNSSINIARAAPNQLSAFLALTDNDKLKIQKSGRQAIGFDQIDSESQHQYSRQKIQVKQQNQQIYGEASSQQNLKIQADDSQNYQVNQYLPQDLALFLQQKQIPLEYVRGLLLVRDQKQIKTLRRLKVERYLKKRRNKTWNKKICYNCRQKVAQQRLRIKGKFIKKRRAMQMLKISTPISMSQLKLKLQILLKDKTSKEIQAIIKREQQQ